MTFDLCEHLPAVDCPEGVAHVHLQKHLIGLGIFGPQADLACGSFGGIWHLNTNLLRLQVFCRDNIHQELAGESS